METRTTLFALFAAIIVSVRNIYLAMLEEKMTGQKSQKIGVIRQIKERINTTRDNVLRVFKRDRRAGDSIKTGNRKDPDHEDPVLERSGEESGYSQKGAEHTMRILIACGDEKETVNLYLQALEEHPEAFIYNAKDSDEALLICKNHKPDLIMNGPGFIDSTECGIESYLDL